MRATPWGEMTYIEYKHKLEFTNIQYDMINDYCNQKPIDWSASVWDFDSLEFLMQYDLPFLKIPSAMMTNRELVLETAKTGVPVVMSTGMSSLEEVDDAVDNLLSKTNDIVLMHTNSSYPTPKEEINLSLIPFKRKIWLYNWLLRT